MIKSFSTTRKSCANRRPNAYLMGFGELDLCSERI